MQILKSSRQISMTVRSPPAVTSTASLHGFGQPRDPVYGIMAPQLAQTHPILSTGLGNSNAAPLAFRQTCSWMDRQGRPASPPIEYGDRRTERDRYK